MHAVPLLLLLLLREVNVYLKYVTNLKLSFPLPPVFFSWPQASIVTVIQLVNNVVDTIENEGICFFLPWHFFAILIVVCLGVILLGSLVLGVLWSSNV